MSSQKKRAHPASKAPKNEKELREKPDDNPDRESRLSVRIRESRLIRARLQGKSKAESMEVAGYSPETKAAPVFKRIEGRLAIALESAGLDDRTLAQSIIDGLNCTQLKVIHAASGEVREVSDNTNRVRWAELATTVRGDRPPRIDEATLNVVVTLDERRRHHSTWAERVAGWALPSQDGNGLNAETDPEGGLMTESQGPGGEG